MPLDIWNTDPENKPEKREKYSDDTVGRLHSGYTETTEDGKSYPAALTEWRFSTGDMKVARAVAELFGGSPVEDDESQNENFIDVFTAAAKIPVVIAPGGIVSDMKQWANGKLVHHCTGSVFLSHPLNEDLIGQPCNCPRLFAERKDAAKANMGPKPSITVTFRLADDPDLGEFKWQSGSWLLAAVLHETEEALDRIAGPALASLELEEVSYVAKKGKMKGQRVEYTKPVISVRRSYNDAIADAV